MLRFTLATIFVAVAAIIAVIAAPLSGCSRSCFDLVPNTIVIRTDEKRNHCTAVIVTTRDNGGISECGSIPDEQCTYTCVGPPDDYRVDIKRDDFATSFHITVHGDDCDEPLTEVRDVNIPTPKDGG